MSVVVAALSYEFIANCRFVWRHRRREAVIWPCPTSQPRALSTSNRQELSGLRYLLQRLFSFARNVKAVSSLSYSKTLHFYFSARDLISYNTRIGLEPPSRTVFTWASRVQTARHVSASHWCPPCTGNWTALYTTSARSTLKGLNWSQPTPSSSTNPQLHHQMHWLYQSFENIQVDPAWHTVPPVQPNPPH